MTYFVRSKKIIWLDCTCTCVVFKQWNNAVYTKYIGIIHTNYKCSHDAMLPIFIFSKIFYILLSPWWSSSWDSTSRHAYSLNFFFKKKHTQQDLSHKTQREFPFGLICDSPLLVIHAVVRLNIWETIMLFSHSLKR